MIIYQDRFAHTLVKVQEVLVELRYNWLYRQIKGLGYFLDPSLADIPPAINELLLLVGVKPNILLRLLRLGQSLARADVQEIFSDELINELIDLGLLVDSGGRLSTDGYTIIPWLGLYIIANSNIMRIGGQLEPAHYELAYKLMSSAGNQALDLNPGAGLTTLVMAQQYQRVFALTSESESQNVLQANAALNGLSSQIQLVSHIDELSSDQEIEHIFSTETQPAILASWVAQGLVTQTFESRLAEVEAIFSRYAQAQSTILLHLLGTETEPLLLSSWQERAEQANRATKVYILARKYIEPADYFKLTTKLYWLRHNPNYEEALYNESVAEVVAYYDSLQVKCIYKLFIESHPASVSSWQLTQLTSTLTSQDQLVIPENLVLVEQSSTILTAEKSGISMPIDEIEVTIVELLKREELLVSEIAEQLVAQYNLEFNTAANRVLDFCWQLAKQGLICSPSTASLVGQMRMFSISVNQFANTLQNIEVDSQ